MDTTRRDTAIRAARRRGRFWLPAVLVLALGLALTTPRGASMQEALTIVSVDYESGGRLSAALSTASSDVPIADVRAVVDGVPYPVEVLRETALPVSVVIAVDTSGSMAGEPLEAARAAALELVGRLDPEDRVAVVSFSDTPIVISTFEAGVPAAVEGIRNLWLGGNTALYGALEESLRLIEGEAATGDRTRAIVLLSDGQDTETAPDAAEGRRAALLDAVATSASEGVQLHAFAFGADADLEFLAQASERGAGGFWSVSDAGALSQLYSFLGARLAASTEVSVAVPPLERGTHEVVLRARVGAQRVETSAEFVATNEHFLFAKQREGDPTGPLVLDLTTAVDVEGLVYSARGADRTFEVLPNPPRVLIDPWALSPGPVTLTVEATTADGTAVGVTDVTIEVPALAPQLAFTTETGTNATTAVVAGRAQAVESPRIVVRAAGEVIAEGPARELRFTLPSEGDSVTAELMDGSRVLRALPHSLNPVASADPSGMPVAEAVSVLAFLGLAGASAWWLRRRSHAAPATWRPSGRTSMVGRPVAGTAQALRALGTVIVQPPGGEPREYELRRRPLSVGSGAGCDVEIHDDGVAAVHARLYALGDGEFRIHGIAPRGIPDPGGREDEWLVVRHGEQIAIGRHLLTVYAAEHSLSGGGAA